MVRPVRINLKIPTGLLEMALPLPLRLNINNYRVDGAVQHVGSQSGGSAEGPDPSWPWEEEGPACCWNLRSQLCGKPTLPWTSWSCHTDCPIFCLRPFSLGVLSLASDNSAYSSSWGIESSLWVETGIWRLKLGEWEKGKKRRFLVGREGSNDEALCGDWKKKRFPAASEPCGQTHPCDASSVLSNFLSWPQVFNESQPHTTALDLPQMA